MDIRLIRRANLALLIQEAGTVAALARRTGVSDKYLRQILAGFQGAKHKSPREIGHDIARRLEQGTDKVVGWMDIDHSASAKSTTLHAREPSLSADEYEMLALWRVLLDEQRSEFMTWLRTEADRVRQIEEELRKRRLDRAVPDGEVARHLPPRPAQRELPIPTGAAPKKPGKR